MSGKERLRVLVILTLVAIVLATAAFLALHMTTTQPRTAAPSFNELYRAFNGSVYTAYYEVRAATVFMGQVNAESYALTYGQRGNESILMKLNLSTPMGTQVVYLLATKLINGSRIQCAYSEGLGLASCSALDQPMPNLLTIYARVPWPMRFLETTRHLGQEAYCYVGSGNSTLGELVGPSAGLLALLPVVFRVKLCLLGTGALTTLVYEVHSAQGTVDLGLNLTLAATRVFPNYYPEEEFSALLAKLNVTVR